MPPTRSICLECNHVFYPQTSTTKLCSPECKVRRKVKQYRKTTRCHSCNTSMYRFFRKWDAPTTRKHTIYGSLGDIYGYLCEECATNDD